ncbi:hypothetical protein VSS74_00190 [Conexibacter stalactiti]|uniref:Uncharacterized protein n=1 Tax=Conexibacter stalactiti TaxID=1940611 RepID=A0ABU4HHE8_9ACTN|nr:hypothetical protein [Conexibacter stalactiti]MDW5592733.1 hypothetical protein [Conexibacter stalactiti]MEC5033374.1 hypothetical protein [Conexibacter stalactiti]
MDRNRFRARRLPARRALALTAALAAGAGAGVSSTAAAAPVPAAVAPPGARAAAACLTGDFARFAVVRAGAVRLLHARGDAAGARTARALAPEVGTKIYPRFLRLLGRRPPSDARERCFHGPDGALDVYVTEADRVGPMRVPARAAAFVHPYDPERNCAPGEPVFAVVRPGVRPAVLAHEIFHAFQAAFRTKERCINYSEWSEASATWAGDWIYPRDDVEHDHRGALEQPELPVHFWGYATWVFPRYLTEKFGTGVIRRIEQAKARWGDSVHIDKAIPGGLRARFPEFGLYAWNSDPLPRGLGPSFRAWDRIDHAPRARTTALKLAGARRASAPVPVRSLRILSREYRRITIPDAAVRRVTFVNPAAATPNFHVRALVRRGDGTWRAENWDGRATVEFCREDPAEDVREIVLEYANSTLDNKRRVTAATRFDVEDSCALRYRVLAVRIATSTTASASDTLCGTQAGSIQFDGVGGPLPFDGRSVLAPVRGSVEGEIEGRAPATWHGHHVEGCRSEDSGRVRCVLDLPDRKVGGDGLWPVSFAVSGGWNDPEWELRWALPDPAVGYVDASDDACNVYVWGGFMNGENVRREARATFLRTDPVTLTFTGSGRPGFVVNNPDATIGYTWSLSLTFQRVDGNGQPLA